MTILSTWHSEQQQHSACQYSVHDTQNSNNIQHINTQPDDIYNEKHLCNTNDTQHGNIQHNDTKQNDAHHNETHDIDTQH